MNIPNLLPKADVDVAMLRVRAKFAETKSSIITVVADLTQLKAMAEMHDKIPDEVRQQFPAELADEADVQKLTAVIEQLNALVGALG